MRVAFAGASGTGKTTLTKLVAEYYGLPINPHGSRSVAFSMGLLNPYQADELGIRETFQYKVLAAKSGWESENDAFVTDRTGLDQLAYFALHLPDALDEQTVKDHTRLQQRYTHIFYLPVSDYCNPGDDPDRKSSLAYQKVYDVFLRGLLEYGDSSVRYHELKGSIEQRMATIKAVLA